MLFSPETVNTVNQVIEMSFEQGTEPCSDSTIEGVLNSVSRMVEVCRYFSLLIFTIFFNFLKLISS